MELPVVTEDMVDPDLLHICGYADDSDPRYIKIIAYPSDDPRLFFAERDTHEDPVTVLILL